MRMAEDQWRGHLPGQEVSMLTEAQQPQKHKVRSDESRKERRMPMTAASRDPSPL
jgi:hypothetical protein